MKKTDYLDQSQLKNQSSEVKSNLTENTNQLNLTKASVVEFIQSEKLKSKAYSELKQHMRDYAKLIRAMIKANRYDDK